ncbi:MAG: cation-translocating P-type ATPase [Lachnospiraceae bacterium]|jgi:heavy metal translocating P-type ATPase|nr:cation-translocating P-type ATPase [Lachnospiraceae bacterium]
MIIEKWVDGDTKCTVFCVLVSAVSLVFSLGGWLSGILPFDTAWIAIALCGIPIIYSAVTALIRKHDIKADLLVSMALVASVCTGEYFAAGEVALIMQIGSLLEQYTSDKARQGIEKLIRLTPQTARVKRDGADVIIPASEVAAGDLLTVLAGEIVPVDGMIIAGETSIDQSVMTGESIPVDKKAGDSVTSGTVNQFGTFEMQAQKRCTDSSLQKMIRLAREADADKAPIVGLADRWATWMVIAAVTIAVITGLATGRFIRAVTVLVVFCPCAFILATPTAIMAGIGNAAKYGVLIRSGDALERLSKVRMIAFDKTGTLTRGKPEVTAAVSVNKAYSETDIMRYTALAEQKSEHPLGKAILARYIRDGGRTCSIENFKMFAGKGVRAEVCGHSVIAGKSELMEDLRIALTEESRQKAEQYCAAGATVIYTAIDGELTGFLALADILRPDAAETVGKLKSAGIDPLLLTGDNAAAAGEIAKKVGIDNVQANLLPDEKMQIIRELNGKGMPVCMIGDGVNDALALSTAYAGIAMGETGSDIAVESADAVLVSDEIHRLPYLFGLTGKVMQRVNQNIILSLCINIVAVLLAVCGVLNPVTGALMHNCGSVLVVVNAAMLLREKDQ